MDIDTLYPSAFLKSADVTQMPGGEMDVVIESCAPEMVGQGEDASSLPVLRFCNQQSGLVLNKTNSNTIKAAFGNMTEDWTGARIVVYSTKVPFKGDMVDGLRVRVPQQTQVAKSEVVNVDAADDVPF